MRIIIIFVPHQGINKTLQLLSKNRYKLKRVKSKGMTFLAWHSCSFLRYYWICVKDHKLGKL